MKKRFVLEAFFFCITLTLYSQTAADFKIEGGVLVSYLNNYTMTHVNIPANLGITEIQSGAFSNDFYWGINDIVTSITIPASVTIIRDGAFNGCRNLTTITVNGQNTMFSSENGVLFNKNKTVLYHYPAGKQEKTYTIPTSVTIIKSYAFENCKLSNITIPASVTSIGDMAFFNSDLTRITIPTGVISIGDMAFEASSLSEVTIPASVTSIGSRAFFFCQNLTSITVNGQNREYSSEDGVLFNKNKTLLIQFPGGKQGNYTIPASISSIEIGAFYRCYKITGVTIPASVTSIGKGTFFMCSSLNNITIPASVSLIGYGAFFGCDLSPVIRENIIRRFGEAPFIHTGFHIRDQ